jgi:hypothetical protein
MRKRWQGISKQMMKQIRFQSFSFKVGVFTFRKGEPKNEGSAMRRYGRVIGALCLLMMV